MRTLVAAADEPQPLTRALAHGVRPARRIVRAADIVAAEWLKLWSLRSNTLLVAATLVAAPAIALPVARGTVSYIRSGMPHGPIGHDPLGLSFRGLAIAQLLVAVLGALSLTGEYGCGSIRATFVSVPHRASVVLAKLAVTVGVALVLGQLVAFGCFLGTQAILHPVHLGLPVDGPGVPGALAGAGCYLAVIAAVGVGVGALVRSTAGALAAVVVFFFLLPQAVSALPEPWRHRVADTLPATAAQQISALKPDPALLTRGHAYLVLLAYAVLVPLAGVLVIRRRDH